MYSAGRKLKEIDQSRQRLRARIALRRQRCRSLAVEIERPVDRTLRVTNLIRLVVAALPFTRLLGRTGRRTSRGVLWLRVLLQAWRLGTILRGRRRA